MTSGSTQSVVCTSSRLLKFFVASVSKLRVDAFDRKRFPFKSLDVNLLRAFTSRTFTLAGAGLDATTTHEGGGFLFGGIARAVDSERALSTSL